MRVTVVMSPFRQLSKVATVVFLNNVVGNGLRKSRDGNVSVALSRTCKGCEFITYKTYESSNVRTSVTNQEIHRNQRNKRDKTQDP